MIEQWILEKIEPHKQAPLIILRDPQRVIQPGARVVDGWAEENGFTVLMCTGNLALREMVELTQEDPEARLLLVDRSRTDAKIPLFYPDLAAAAPHRRQMTLSLRDFLVETTGDSHWPHLADDRVLSRLLVDNLSGTFEAHRQLRLVSSGRFSDSDLYKIVLGAVLKINPFKKLTAGEIRRLCIEEHHQIDSLTKVLPADVMDELRQTIQRAPRPFCWLLDRDPEQVVRAFTLAAIMYQHDLEYQVLLPNLDPALHEYRDIDSDFLDRALEEQMTADPDRVVGDVQEAEAFLLADPTRLAFLLRDRLEMDQPQHGYRVLESERLSPLVRGMALVSLLADLLINQKAALHEKTLKLLDQQNQEAPMLAQRRPTEAWTPLESAYRRAYEILALRGRLARHAKRLQVASVDELRFETFDQLWNTERLNRLDYYCSDLERTLRTGHLLPVPLKAFWPELLARWSSARDQFKAIAGIIGELQNLVDARFQDLYRAHYSTWIRQDDSPMVFTHQFLPRMLKAHWDPQSGQKAVVMVFDGLRTDAWDELLRPVLEENHQVIESRPGSALIPTETHLSRKAISAGCLPEAFSSRNELALLQKWLRNEMGLNPIFQTVKDDDTVASGMTVRYVSEQLEYIVFNFSDQNLHHNAQDLAFIYDTTVQEIIRQDVRAMLRELPEDALLFVTSDHGFIPVPGPTVTVPAKVVVDRHDIKYRHALTIDHLPGKDARQAIEFDVRQMGIPTTSATLVNTPVSYVLFPRPGTTLCRPKWRHDPDRYTHGGLSLAECLVPMVVLGRQRGVAPALLLESVRQVGSVIEGEMLSLEVTVGPRQTTFLPEVGTEDMVTPGGEPRGVPITLSFSREEIPYRREVFTGHRTNYTVRWQPQLGDMSDADRQQGVVTLPVTAVLSYRQAGEPVRLSKTAEVRVKLDPIRLRRRVDSKLDLLMGKVPKGLKS